MATESLLINRRASELPERYRTVFEPNRTIPSSVRFIKQDPYLDLGPTLIGAFFLVAFGVVMIVSLPGEVTNQLARGPLNTGQFVFWLVLLVLGLGLLITGIVLPVSVWQDIKKQREAGFRFGLFLFSEGLLLRLYKRPVSLIPRELIMEVCYEPKRPATSPRVLLKLAPNDSGLEWFQLTGELPNLQMIAHTIRDWQREHAQADR